MVLSLTSVTFRNMLLFTAQSSQRPAQPPSWGAPFIGCPRQSIYPQLSEISLLKACSKLQWNFLWRWSKFQESQRVTAECRLTLSSAFWYDDWPGQTIMRPWVSDLIRISQRDSNYVLKRVTKARCYPIHTLINYTFDIKYDVSRRLNATKSSCAISRVDTG